MLRQELFKRISFQQRLLAALLGLGLSGVAAAMPDTFREHQLTEARRHSFSPLIQNEEPGSLDHRALLSPVDNEAEQLNPSFLNATAESAKYTVECIFENAEFPFLEVYNTSITIAADMQAWMESGTPDRYTFTLPEGTYDFVASLPDPDDRTDMSLNAYVIYEDVEVKHDMTLNFSLAQASERIVVHPYLSNGEEMKLPVGHSTEDGRTELDTSGANTEMLFYNFTLFKEGCDPIFLGEFFTDFCAEGGNRDLNMYTTPVSDKYHMVVYTFLATYEEGLQLSATDIAGFTTKTVESYHSNAVNYPVPEFADTPLYREYGTEYGCKGILGQVWIDNVQMLSGGIYSEDCRPEVLVACQPSSQLDIKLAVQTESVQSDYYTPMGWEREIIIALPAIYQNNEWVYINRNHSANGSFYYQLPSDGTVMYSYPGYAPYCFGWEDQEFGNSAPLCVILTQDWSSFGLPVITFGPEAYIGRYGEVRSCDLVNLETTVEDADGKLLYTNKDGMSLEDWCWNYFGGSHNAGILKATFTDKNVLVDNKIKGFNVTTMTIDETQKDMLTPTAQMLTFKNTAGEIIDRFENAKDGVIEFSAGDFYWVPKDRLGYFAVEEADVKVEYAPYGEDIWGQIEVEEVPEYFFMPGFGYFYRGSLEDVSLPSSNGWYDVRLTLTDKAGNVTTEHISPAFKIGSGSNNVNSIFAEGIKVWLADGSLHAVADEEIVALDVMSLDGRLLGRSDGATIAAPDAPGVVLVKVTTQTGKTRIMKVIV